MAQRKYDAHTKSLAKTITWRITATTTTMIAVYLLTGQIGLSLGVGALEGSAKLVLYYLHERLWLRFHW